MIKYKNKQNLRKLNENDDEIVIKEIIESAHKINKIIFDNRNKNTFKIRINRNNLNQITFLSYSKDNLNSILNLIQLISTNLTIIDFSECSNCTSIYITSIYSNDWYEKSIVY